jgi:hypothetical protein
VPGSAKLSFSGSQGLSVNTLKPNPVERMTDMNAMLAAQAAIRHQAEEQQESLADLASWMSSIKKKDEKLRSSRASVSTAVSRPLPPPSLPPPAPSGGGSVTAVVHRGPNNSAADHTYDRGYRKWESFDVDAALRDDESRETRAATQASDGIMTESPQSASARPSQNAASSQPSAVASPMNLATTARESGNACFKRGDYAGAVSAYTHSLDLDQNRWVLSCRRLLWFSAGAASPEQENDNSSASLDLLHSCSA